MNAVILVPALADYCNDAYILQTNPAQGHSAIAAATRLYELRCGVRGLVLWGEGGRCCGVREVGAVG